ncbi:hypothetical protein [Candidatus Thiodictyon syntrophicum]|jgi:hypothetical protein|uniref:Lipoprotein n=1 Tax=Candidatus Thiodictyon syntrophicum TaxID=1166950 RepID=A0A2K8UGB8_9GAMM|nr:hypothetical protein [Candidatus Thiodictyon syntrophicum]AUB84572.1 hypothetical protein THSYN_29000 [Candidatus Thiodictyon syntrophicum]
MRGLRIHIFVGLMAVILLSGCDFLSLEQVPGPEAIRGRMGRFLVNPDQIRGVYRNLDIDSLVFTYTARVDGETAFWGRLEEGLQGSRWTETERRGAMREYRRSYREGECDAERPDLAIFSSFEVARVFFDPTSQTVAMAYVQADGRSSDMTFEDTGESQWVEKAIWPRFRDLVSGK